MNTKIYTTQGNLLRTLLVSFSVILFSAKTIAQPVVALSPVIDTGLVAPISVVNAGDGTNRVFVVQQGGTIRAYDASFNYLSDFLTVSNVNFSGERGLLSMAFHPNYATNGFFFVYYVNSAGGLELARYQVSSTDPNVADPDSKQIVITIAHPRYANHNGGELHFGVDGYLYLSTGDGGGTGDVSNNAQNTNVLLGKMLRFDVNTSATAPFYTVPAGNPYGNPIYDLGLRNPFRWSFDSQTNDMWIGDVGQDAFEEINYRPADSTGGVNYGWHCYEGAAPYNTTGCAPASSYVLPIYTYPSQNPSAAITGGIVYRGTAYPVLQGYHLSADVYTGTFYLTVSDGAGGWTTTTQVLSPAGIVDFGETEDGEGYAVSITENAVYHITASGPLPVSLVSFTGANSNHGVKLNWVTSMEQSLRQFEVEYSTNGSSFTSLGNVLARNAATGSSYMFLHPVAVEGNVFYRLKIISSNGNFKYSDVVKIVISNKGKSIVVPSVINNGIINVNLANSSYTSLELIGMNGTVVLQKSIAGQVGSFKVPVGKIPTGVYTIRLIGTSSTEAQRILIQ